LAAPAGGIAWFNALPLADVRQQLLACCASPAWADGIIEGRPYESAEALIDHSARILGSLPWEEILTALGAHPRIGEAPTGTGREAEWSRQEQAGATGSKAELRQANLAYEERFDHVFLIFATGRTDAEMLAEARRRVGNDPVAEQAEVRAELAKIAALRLMRTLA
jgi:2-oxo-4-hydroxy-4-carboxy-5-ureidoimidazoline decarboxylase